MVKRARDWNGSVRRLQRPDIPPSGPTNGPPSSQTLRACESCFRSSAEELAKTRRGQRLGRSILQVVGSTMSFASMRTSVRQPKPVSSESCLTPRTPALVKVETNTVSINW